MTKKQFRMCNALTSDFTRIIGDALAMPVARALVKDERVATFALTNALVDKAVRVAAAYCGREAALESISKMINRISETLEE